jgi:tetratricopeptide (TPR) repeat protein
MVRGLMLLLALAWQGPGGGPEHPAADPCTPGTTGEGLSFRSREERRDLDRPRRFTDGKWVDEASGVLHVGPYDLASRLDSRFKRAGALIERADGASGGGPADEERARALYTEAARELERVVEEAPTLEVADRVLVTAAKTFEKAGRFTESARLYARVEAEYPESEHVPFAMLRLAELQEQDGDREACTATLERFLERFPEADLSPRIQRYLKRLRAGPAD